MPRFALLALVFFSVPLIELSLLIKVGGVIGVGWTLALVVLSAAAGAWLLRMQGLQTLRRAQAVLDEGGLPAMEILEGVALLVAGALLLTPGFVTDGVGLCLLLPGLRRRLLARVARNLVVRSASGGPGPARPPRQGQTIEGEFTRED